MPNKDGLPIGIDFGTSYSSAAIAAPEANGKIKPHYIPNEDGIEKIPTAVYFSKDGHILVGNDALNAGNHSPDRLYVEFKRNLDPNFPYLRALPNGSSVSANQLASAVLESLFINAEKNGGDLQKMVICHPVGKTWQQIIKKIANNINGKNIYPISEPEAVLYYAHWVEGLFDEQTETVLMIDFGGGTCDFLLMNVKASIWKGFSRPIPEIIDEDRLDFGGKDIDQILVNEFICKWKEKYPSKVKLIESFNNPAIYWELKKQAKLIKETLSRFYLRGIRESIVTEFTGLPGNTKLIITLSPQNLFELTSRVILDKFSWLLMGSNPDNHHRPLLGRKGIKPDDVTMIVLAGGSNQLPWIRGNILPSLFPALSRKKQIYLLEKPDMAVSYGAALFAYDLFSEGKPKLPKYLFENLKFELEDGNTYSLANIGTLLPLSKSKFRNYHTFRFPKTGKFLNIQLRAGEDQRAAYCRQLSYEPKVIEFDEPIQAGTLMQVKVQINTKGEVNLSISKTGFSWTKKETKELFFQTLDIRSNLVIK